ncbi:hypothetical protein D3C77_805260 [compost metagenome]
MKQLIRYRLSQYSLLLERIVYERGKLLWTFAEDDLAYDSFYTFGCSAVAI